MRLALFLSINTSNFFGAAARQAREIPGRWNRQQWLLVIVLAENLRYRPLEPKRETPLNL